MKFAAGMIIGFMAGVYGLVMMLLGVVGGWLMCDGLEGSGRRTKPYYYDNMRRPRERSAAPRPTQPTEAP